MRSPMPIEQLTTPVSGPYADVFSWVAAQMYDVRRGDDVVGYVTTFTVNVKPELAELFAERFDRKMFWPRVSAWENYE